MNLTESDIAKFFSKIDKSSGCWIWTKSTAGGGYGTVTIRYKHYPAHRVSWVISGRNIPDGFYVMSKCGNRLCCNPDHLFTAKHHGEGRRIDRFWKLVDKKSDEECWNWTGTLNGFGYGMMLVDYKGIRAHRFSWELHNDCKAGDFCVLHKCDNPSCVNPKHLFLGTRKDNNQDMHAKGRNNQPKAEKHFCAKLTPDSVRAIIKHKNVDAMTMARKYGVARSSIYHIRNRITWKSVNA